jgi:hypothetical protein
MELLRQKLLIRLGDDDPPTFVKPNLAGGTLG